MADGDPPTVAEVSRRVLTQTTAYATLRATAGAFTWVAFVILSRILDQRSFGAFEIGMFYIGLGQILGDGGLAASLIRKKGTLSKVQYQTALTTVLAIAASMALLLEIFAPMIGRANQLTSNEVWALRALAPLYCLPALRLVPYVKLERNIDFASIGQIELYSNLARLASAIIVAALSGGVWALAVSQLVFATLQITLAYRKAPGWVGLGWERNTFTDLFGYGSKVQASILFMHLKGNLAAGLLGPTVGPAAVGVFRFGIELVRVPSDIVGSLARIQFPAYAQLDDPAELGRLLRGTLRGALLLGLPVLAVLALGAEWLVPFIYGEKWRAALPVILALIPHIAADLLIYHLITFVQGRGRAGLALLAYAFWSGALWLLGVAALMLVPGSLGTVAASHGLASALTLVALLVWCSRALARSLFRDIAWPVVSAAAAFAAAFLARSAVSTSADLVRALAAIVAFLATFAGCLFALERRTLVREVRTTLAILRSRNAAKA